MPEVGLSHFDRHALRDGVRCMAMPQPMGAGRSKTLTGLAIAQPPHRFRATLEEGLDLPVNRPGADALDWMVSALQRGQAGPSSFRVESNDHNSWS